MYVVYKTHNTYHGAVALQSSETIPTAADILAFSLKCS